MTEEKKKQLLELKNKINKQHGDNSILMLDESSELIGDVIPTGSIGLDNALGVGGLPKGRFVEIFGPESSGKTTLAIHVIAEAQKLGNTCAFIDVEHAFQKEYAERLGVNTSELLMSQPMSGEEALQIADEVVKSGFVDVVVLDSIAALVPQKEIDGDVGDSNLGLQARMMGQALRKLNPFVGKNNVLFIFINQIREKIGVMFGSPETTTGGNAMKFYSSVRIDIRRSLASDNMVKEGKDNIGNLTKINIIKNKVAPPFQKCEFDIIWGEGIDKIGEIIKYGSQKDVFKKWGDKITYGEDKYTTDEFKDLIINNEEFKQELTEKIKQSFEEDKAKK